MSRKGGGGPAHNPGNASSVRSIRGGTARCSRIAARAVVSLCALLWVSEPLSVAYAGLTERGRISDCHQTQAHPENGPGNCASHCYAMDSQAADVRNRSSTPTSDGFVLEGLQALCAAGRLYQGVVPRGPPAS